MEDILYLLKAIRVYLLIESFLMLIDGDFEKKEPKAMLIRLVIFYTTFLIEDFL